MISVRNLSVRYANSQQLALEHFTLEAAKGSLTVLYGPSGSGKSSIFKCLTGELPIENGEVLIDGTSIGKLTGRALAGYRGTIGILSQEIKLLEDRTVEENILLPLELSGVSKSRRNERLTAVLERFSLVPMRALLPTRLSLSERQRVCLARSVIAEPLVLLADDPTAHLDPNRSQEVIRLLRDENFRGMTVLLGTKDDRITRLMPESSIISLERPNNC